MADILAPQFLRQPPASIQMEQWVLGGIMYDPRLLDKVIAFLRPEHFMDPINGELYRIMTARINAGRSVDGVALAEDLKTRPLFDPVGGSTYCASLMEHMVSKLHVEPFARAIADAGLRRAMIDLCETTLDQCYSPPVDSKIGALPDTGEMILERLLASIDDLRGGFLIGRGKMSGDEVMDMAIARAREAEAAGGTVGLSTGMPTIDEIMGGMVPGNLVLLGGRPGIGKAQPIDAPVLRADGTWSRMGDLRIGDALASIDGDPNLVLATHERHHRQVYRVTFSDGRSTEVCAEHLWSVRYRDWDAYRTIDTVTLARMLTCVRYKKRLSVDLVSGDFGAGDLPLDPYVLGALLGDGGLTSGSTPKMTCPDPEILAEMQRRLGRSVRIKKVAGIDTYSLTSRDVDDEDRITEPGVRFPRTVYPAIRALRQMGIAGLRSEQKFIPPEYLRASRQDRLDLLRGLMDTDGWTEKHASVRFSSASRPLAEGVQALVRSLGGVCDISEKQPSLIVRGVAIDCLPAFLCEIRHERGDLLFNLRRKADRAVRKHNLTVRLAFASIEPSRVAETRCITVSHPSRLYVTDDYILTHNSALAMQWAVHAAITCRATPDLGGVFVISLEMAGEEIGARMLATQAEVNSATLFRGRMAGHEHRIMQARTDLDALPLLFEAERNLTISQIRAKAREAQRHFKKLALVVIDHLHLVAPEEADERHGPTHSMGKISASAKMMADEFGCPVLALAQLNRGLEAREDKRPNLSDLRQAGSLEQDADIVAFVFRAEYYMSAEAPDRKASEKPDAYDARCRAQREQLANAAGKAEVIFAKLRNGAPGTAHLRWRAETTSFEDGPRTGADEALIPF